jgi:molybdopterin-guanine dinucleotide biosynthesis protein A
VRAAILTGGRGSRVGGDKPNLDLGGRPMVEWVEDAARAAGLEPVRIADRAGDIAHPLAGVVAALERFGEPLVVIACDVPFVDPGLLRAVASAPPGAAMVEGNPLVARYEPAHLPHFRDALLREAPLRATVAALDPHVVAGHVTNVNSPEDLADARAWAASRAPTRPGRPRSPSSRSGPRP